MLTVKNSKTHLVHRLATKWDQQKLQLQTQVLNDNWIQGSTRHITKCSSGLRTFWTLEKMGWHPRHGEEFTVSSFAAEKDNKMAKLSILEAWCRKCVCILRQGCDYCYVFFWDWKHSSQYCHFKLTEVGDCIFPLPTISPVCAPLLSVYICGQYKA